MTARDKILDDRQVQLREVMKAAAAVNTTSS